MIKDALIRQVKEVIEKGISLEGEMGTEKMSGLKLKEQGK